MYIPAPRIRATDVFLNSMSDQSIGYSMRDIGNANPASVAWTTANQARYVPFRILTPSKVLKLLVYNGTTAAGNTDVGIFTAAGVKLVSSGAVAQAGVSAWQEFDITDTWLTPGQYWFGMISSSTTATVIAWNSKPAGQLVGVASQAVGAATLPATATFAVLDIGLVPLIGASLRVLI